MVLYIHKEMKNKGEFIMNNLVPVNHVEHDFIEDNMIRLVNANASKARERKIVDNLEAENRVLRNEIKRRDLHKKKVRKNVAKTIEIIIFMISLIFLIWVGVSYLNVISHNMEPGQSALIWNWNFFKVFFK